MSRDESRFSSPSGQAAVKAVRCTKQDRPEFRGTKLSRFATEIFTGFRGMANVERVLKILNAFLLILLGCNTTFSCQNDLVLWFVARANLVTDDRDIATIQNSLRCEIMICRYNSGPSFSLFHRFYHSPDGIAHLSLTDQATWGYTPNLNTQNMMYSKV